MLGSVNLCVVKKGICVFLRFYYYETKNVFKWLNSSEIVIAVALAKYFCSFFVIGDIRGGDLCDALTVR